MSVSQLTLSSLNSLSEFYSTDELNAIIAEINRKFVRVTSVINSGVVPESNVALDANIDPALQIGQPVYYNTTTNRFEASALSVLTGSGGRLYAADTSECWGLVVKICSSGKADVLLSGLYTVDLTASTGEASPSGKFYLSTVAGELVASPTHSLIAPVLFATGSGDVLFRPWFADTFPRYTPSMVEIQKQAAGTPVVIANKYRINGPNATVLGWLPANHFIFNGLAPEGAKFGYNISQDEQLSASWPPVNPRAAKLYLEAGGTTSKGSRVLLGDDEERLVINDDGIWWMTDNVSQVPWNITTDGQSTGTNPLAVTQRLVLEADLLVYGNSTLDGVASLISNVAWLRVVKAGSSNRAVIGDLAIEFDGAKMASQDVRFGSVAIGVPVSGAIPSTYIVSGLKSGNAAVSLSGTRAGSTYVGEVTLTVVAAMDLDLLPVDTQLLGATAESYADLLAIGLPPGCDTSFILSFHIPSSVPADSNVVFDFWLTSQSQIALPAGVSLKSTVFPKPTGTPALADIPVEQDLTLNYIAGTIVPTDKYLSASSANVTVSGGDTVYIKMARAGSTDGVDAELHVLKVVGRFVSGV